MADAAAKKLFITAQELLRDSFLLAAYESGLRPDFIVGIWRGGAPVGSVVQEYFQYRGVAADHIAIRTESYDGMVQRTGAVRVFGLQYIIDTVEADDTLLIVDDVFDSGRSIKAVIDELRSRMRRNLPETIRVACPWYKPSHNRTDLRPDYYLHETDAWLMFPHELCGLTAAELAAGKEDLVDIWKHLNL